MRLSLLDLKARGAAVLARFSGLDLPDELLAHLEAFRAAHRAFEDAVTEAAEALRASQAADREIADRDAALDAQVFALADALVGAGLGERKNPFARFSKHAPGAIAALAYGNGVKAVRNLVAKIERAAPPKPVAAKLAACLEHAARVQGAMQASARPLARFRFSRDTRDRAVAEWKKAFSRLRLRAQIAYEDNPEHFDSLFAPPSRLDRPVSRRRPKKTSPPPRYPVTPE